MHALGNQILAIAMTDDWSSLNYKSKYKIDISSFNLTWVRSLIAFTAFNESPITALDIIQRHLELAVSYALKLLTDKFLASVSISVGIVKSMPEGPVSKGQLTGKANTRSTYIPERSFLTQAPSPRGRGGELEG